MKTLNNLIPPTLRNITIGSLLFLTMTACTPKKESINPKDYKSDITFSVDTGNHSSAEAQERILEVATKIPKTGDYILAMYKNDLRIFYRLDENRIVNSGITEDGEDFHYEILEKKLNWNGDLKNPKLLTKVESDKFNFWDKLKSRKKQ